jgi:hypothetical protein
MLRSDDIEAAGAAGIITAGQAAELERIAAERRRHRAFVVGREEPFRLLGGFGDFFIAVGVLLLGIGLFYGMHFTLQGPSRPQGPSSAGLAMAAWLTFGALSMWGLAEYLTGRLKLVAPSILLVIFMTLLAAAAAINWAIYLSGMKTHNDFPLYGALVALAVTLLHYRRFLLPFSLLPIAASSVVVVVLCYSMLMQTMSGMSQRDIAGHLHWIAFVCGTLIFGVAMWFDTSDPERLTRRADCAFWLHVVAAPLIVHPLAAPLISHPLFGAANSVAVTTTNPILLFPLILALALIALIVDRRALLVAGLGYLGAAMTYSISRLSGEVATAILITLLALGLIIIVLGVSWRDVRGALMRHLPHFPLKTKLPPYTAA